MARRSSSGCDWPQGLVSRLCCVVGARLVAGLDGIGRPRQETPPLVELSALPLKAVETDFAVDSSGFGTKNTRTWFSTKHGKMIESRDWRKVQDEATYTFHSIFPLAYLPQPERSRRLLRGLRQ